MEMETTRSAGVTSRGIPSGEEAGRRCLFPPRASSRTLCWALGSLWSSRMLALPICSPAVAAAPGCPGLELSLPPWRCSQSSEVRGRRSEAGTGPILRPQGCHSAHSRQQGPGWARGGHGPWSRLNCGFSNLYVEAQARGLGMAPDLRGLHRWVTVTVQEAQGLPGLPALGAEGAGAAMCTHGPQGAAGVSARAQQASPQTGAQQASPRPALTRLSPGAHRSLGRALGRG